MDQPLTSLHDHFASLSDPRIDRTKRHLLLDILTIAICAVICGADSWVEIEEFGTAKGAWLRTFLELPNGIPSHDTFGRVFAALDPEQFQTCFLAWVQAAAAICEDQIVALDGKTLRGSRKQGAPGVHLLSALSHHLGLTLAQQAVDDKTNEIT